MSRTPAALCSQAAGLQVGSVCIFQAVVSPASSVTLTGLEGGGGPGPRHKMGQTASKNIPTGRPIPHKCCVVEEQCLWAVFTL